MRILLSVLVGFIGGFMLGIALSSFIGAAGMIFLNEPIGMKYLSYFTAIICSIVLPLIDQKKLKTEK